METKDKGQAVYYYDRAKRMEKAGPYARFMAEHYGAKRPGILRSLTATRPLKSLFLALMFMLVAVLVVGYVQGAKNSGSVAGSRLVSTAMWFDGHVYVTVKRKPTFFGRDAGPQDRLAIEIAAGDGSAHAVAVLQAADDETRLRFEAASKPEAVAVLATAGSGDDASRLEMLVKVE
ncbi:MAG TPA: hypothetical protein PLW80_00480 [Spirochaetales bacterium]|nr:hypothetical protein [Spirochaetales bacterium]HPG86664.1 hypothetical protein [Spirochaetales bacterium]